MANKINLCCPYCGSKKMTVDVDLRVTATVDEKGHLTVKDYWEPAELSEAANEAPAEDLGGWCESCEEYCDYVPGKGFVADRKIASEEAKNKLDAKVQKAKKAAKGKK